MSDEELTIDKMPVDVQKRIAGCLCIRDKSRVSCVSQLWKGVITSFNPKWRLLSNVPVEGLIWRQHTRTVVVCDEIEKSTRARPFEFPLSPEAVRARGAEFKSFCREVSRVFDAQPMSSEYPNPGSLFHRRPGTLWAQQPYVRDVVQNWVGRWSGAGIDVAENKYPRLVAEVFACFDSDALWGLRSILLFIKPEFDDWKNQVGWREILTRLALSKTEKALALTIMRRGGWAADLEKLAIEDRERDVREARESGGPRCLLVEAAYLGYAGGNEEAILVDTLNNNLFPLMASFRTTEARAVFVAR